MNNETTTVVTAIDAAALAKVVNELLSDVRAQMKEQTAEAQRISDEADAVYHVALGLRKSHSGSNFGYHGKLYFREFETPSFGDSFSVEWGGIHGLPQGWRTREPEEVRTAVESIAHITVAQIEGPAKALVAQAKQLQREITIRLAPLHTADNADKEKGLLLELEGFDWQEAAHNKHCTAALSSFPNMSRDSEAIMQGSVLPAHTYYEAVGLQAIASSEAVQKFWADAERLLRQLALMHTQTLVVHIPNSQSSTTDLQVRYDRLKLGVLVFLGIVLAAVLLTGCEFALRHFNWSWLLNHPNSYAIRGSVYLVVVLGILGALVRRFRRFCWGIALLPIVAVLIQVLGGPR